MFNIGIDYNYNFGINTNKGTTTTKTEITGHDLELNGNLNFLKHFNISTDYRYNWKEGNTPSAKPFVVNMLNASFTYKFYKNNAELGLIGYNLLNQNNGFNLYQSASSITRTQHNVLGRYFMISLLYNFSNKGAIKKESDDDY